MPSTKVESLDALTASGTKDAQLIAIMNFMRDVHQAAFIRNQLSRTLGIQLSSVCGRVNELIGDGQLVRYGRVKDAITGRSVETVRAAPDLFAA